VVEIIVLVPYMQPIYVYFGSPEEVHQEIHERRLLDRFPILLRLLLLLLLLLGIFLRFIDLLLELLSFFLPFGLQGSPLLFPLGVASLLVPILAPDKISYRIFFLIIVGCVARVVLNSQNVKRNRLYYT
jgi:AcrR family transcriptional regulator